MKKWDMIEPYYGAHIRVEIGKLYHHGIYVGNDEVVQFGLPMDVYRDPKTVKVIKSPISEFLGGGFLEVRRYDRKELKQKNSDEEIVRIAKGSGVDALGNAMWLKRWLDNHPEDRELLILHVDCFAEAMEILKDKKFKKSLPCVKGGAERM